MRRSTAWTFMASGAVGGIVGALAMAVWIVLYAVFSGRDAWDPLMLGSGSWAGIAVVAQTHLGAVVLGLAAHLAELAVLGAGFGLGAARFLAGERATRYSAWGFVYGSMLWLLARLAEWPMPGPAAGRVAPWAFAVGLVLFGSFAGSYVGSTAGETVPSRR